MAINVCTVNQCSVNALCGPRRQVIIDQLLNRIPKPGAGSNPQQISNIRRLPVNQYRDRDVEEFSKDTSHIQVSVEFNGKTYSQTLEKTSKEILTTVYNLSQQSIDEPVVNIYDIQCKENVKDDEPQINIFDIKIKAQ